MSRENGWQEKRCKAINLACSGEKEAKENERRLELLPSVKVCVCACERAISDSTCLFCSNSQNTIYRDKQVQSTINHARGFFLFVSSAVPCRRKQNKTRKGAKRGIKNIYMRVHTKTKKKRRNKEQDGVRVKCRTVILKMTILR